MGFGARGPPGRGTSAPVSRGVTCVRTYVPHPMDQYLGSGAITQGMVTLDPGRQSRPHTHRVEESMTLLEGRLRVLIGSEVTEVQAPATILAPANTVHAMRNIGTEPVVMCIAYPA